MGSSPTIVGSCPPPDDTLWNKIKVLGYEVTMYDWNNKNKEKRVDMKLGISMVVETLFKAKDPGILVLVAGDGDYEPALEEILKAGWKVEIQFWASGTSRHLKTPDIAHKNKELKIVYKPLDHEYQNFTYCIGPDLTKKKSIFQIEHDMNHTWRNEEIMKCYTELQLFCWWYKKEDGTLELYFNSKAQLERASRWMKKNFPDVNT
ncbi:10160_t:CDS:2, partial [Paraglomus brasilianum]